MDMKSFAIKLIITIITFILIFDDAIADCPGVLAKGGFFSRDNGLLNVINLFSYCVYKYEHISIQNYEKMLLPSNSLKYSTQDLQKLSIVQLYSLSIIYKIKQTKINNAQTWCESNAAQIVEGTMENEIAEKLPADKLHISIQSLIEKIKKAAKICNPNSWCKSNADLEEETPTERVVRICVGELSARGYVYNLGIFNYAFFKKEPSLSSIYTNYLAEVGRKLGNAENASTNTSNIETVKILNANEWCDLHKDKILGYSNERRTQYEIDFEDRREELIEHLYKVCIDVLKADGFIHLTGEDNYKFSMIETYFVKPYTNYLDEEASKLIDEFEGTVKWCHENHYEVGCLKSLTDAGYPECNTGDQNYVILIFTFVNHNTIIDFRNYVNKIGDYLKIIKAMHPSNEIAQAYCMKLLDEKNEDKEVLSSTFEFCEQYKE